MKEASSKFLERDVQGLNNAEELIEGGIDFATFYPTDLGVVYVDFIS
jgi:hypothetical protein